MMKTVHEIRRYERIRIDRHLQSRHYCYSIDGCCQRALIPRTSGWKMQKEGHSLFPFQVPVWTLLYGRQPRVLNHASLGKQGGIPAPFRSSAAGRQASPHS